MFHSNYKSMRKAYFKTLLVAALCLTGGGIGASAYTTNDLTTAGWTQVTDLSSLTLSDYYFMLVDAGTSTYAVANTLHHTGTKPKPYYTNLQNPASVSSEVWIIAQNESGYTLQSYADNSYFNSGSAGWDDYMDATNTNGNFTFTVSEGKYTITSVTTSKEVGPWNDNKAVSLASGYEQVAANKAAGQPGFYLYAISRTNYASMYRSSSVLETEGWIKVTATEGLGRTGFYYMFLDVSEAGYESGLALTQTAQKDQRPTYTAESAPTTNNNQLWTTASYGSGYSLYNVGQSRFIYCAANWNIQPTESVVANSDFIPAVNEGIWTLSNAISTGEFVGRWEDNSLPPIDGEGVAANKAADKGKRKFLIYSIPSNVGVASALPSDGNMEADKWYYFDITTAADNYTATATTLSDIVYTTDGTTNTFAATGNSLSATRYYVKSTSANNLVVAPASYTYTAGTATADVKYVQTGNTVTVTYAGFSTNDPSAKLNTPTFSGVTFGGNTLTVTSTDNGFTFTVPTVEANKDYTLHIPAGAIGYTNGEGTYNVAQDITFTTPMVLDGVYYLYCPKFDRYLSRGSWWGTRAVADIYGYPFQFTTDATGLTTLKGVDNNASIYNNYWLYADGSTPNHFKMESSTVDGYTASGNIRFLNNDLGGTNYLYVNSTDLGNSSYGVAGNSIIDGSTANITDWAQTVWQVVSVADHNTKVNAYPATNKNNVITAASISTTADEFENYLSSNYSAVDESSLISAVVSGSALSTDWKSKGAVGGNTTNKGNIYYSAPYLRLDRMAGYYTYTVSKDNLPGAGIYKVKVAAFDRRTESNDATLYANYGNIGASYLDANGQRVRIKSWKEMYDASGKSTDTWSDQSASMTSGYADNEVYVYLDGSTDLTLTIEKPDYCAGTNGGSYMCFGNVELTYYNTPETATITSSTGFATYVTTNAVDFSKTEGLKAYKAAYADNTITLTEVTTVPAKTPVVLKGDAKTYTLTQIASADAISDNALVAGAKDGDGSTIWALTEQNGKAGFAPVASGVTVPATKAYLVISDASTAKFLPIDGTATGVNAINAAVDSENAPRYNLAGQRVGKNYKGVVIVNGKKLVVK